MDDARARPPLRCDVVLEQTLGHVTHGQNLRRLMPMQPGFEPTFVPVPFDVEGWPRHLPGYGNWTVRAGIRARRGLRSLGDHPCDARFVHTQVPAVLMGRTLTDVPTIVSLDATPKQYDELGEHYAHATGPRVLEHLKSGANRRCFERAAHLVTWAAWTKQGLVDDYGVDPDAVTVIPPGVDTERWLRVDEDASPSQGPVRILFVGGDLRRKGGDLLLEAFGVLRERHGQMVELYMVTPSPVDEAPGVTALSSMTPNSQELIDLYHRCHVFCLPTLGDCLPMVLPEAGAAGLALVSTDVGAIGEIVRDGETGLLVPPGDVAAIGSALERLVTNADLRRRLGRAATDVVVAEHDAATNVGRLVEVIRETAESTV